MDNNPDHKASSLSHEPIQTDVRAVWHTGAWIAAVVVGAFLLILGLLDWLSPGEKPPLASQRGKTELDFEAQSQLQRLRIREQNWLHAYEWVDPADGIARIPIERAMAIVSQTGLQPLSTTNASPPDQSPQR